MKIFRNLRFKNFKKDKIVSYLTYALGEILLVVAGILIAVYINNKNEESKQRKEVNTIFSIIEKDLQNDIEEAKTTISMEKRKDRLYKKFFSNDLTKKDYEENIFTRHLIFGYLEISFNKRGFNLLNQHKNIDESKDSLIIKTIELYTHRIGEVKADDELRNIEFKENFSTWKKKTWWTEYTRQIANKELFKSDKFIDYALNSQEYKNQVASWNFINNYVFIPELEKFIKEAEEVLELIRKRKDKRVAY